MRKLEISYREFKDYLLNDVGDVEVKRPDYEESDLYFVDYIEFSQPVIYANVFYNLLETNNRIPTFKEYMEVAFSKSVEGMTKILEQDGDGDYLLGTEEGIKLMEDVLRFRASRAFNSFILELQVILYLRENYENINIVSNTIFDVSLGIDILAIDMESKKFFPIHITKNTNNIRHKRNMLCEYTVGGITKQYRRNFDNHTYITYGDGNLAGYMKNGLKIFKDDKLKMFFDYEFSLDGINKESKIDLIRVMLDIKREYNYIYL